MSLAGFLNIANELEDVGLVWQPEIGDEILNKSGETEVSVLVDTGGLTPSQLRQAYLWLPSVEQMVLQFEIRQAILFHAGLELTDSSYCYKTVIQTRKDQIEAQAESLRNAMGIALRDFLLASQSKQFH